MQFSAETYSRKYKALNRFCIVCNSFIKKNCRNTYKQYSLQKFCSKICKGVWQSNFITGKANPNYKHGLSTHWQILRGSPKYKAWRQTVFKRDFWTCQACKSKNGDIHAHHIKAFSKHPRLRFNINNGVTLCIKCHKKTDTYGKQNERI